MIALMSERQYFGTDGIRGRANVWPMTAGVAQQVAQAAAVILKTHKTHSRVVIGKDTRLSCYMLEQAMTAGFLSMGMEVLLLGPIPTPAVAFLTKAMRADLGVMISASHNPYEDNGIKLFGSDGFKLSDAKEGEIEALMAGDMTQHLADPTEIGQAKRLSDGQGRYIEHIKSARLKHFSGGLNGLKVVVDCANGAAYQVAPQTFWELGADVIPLSVAPNGRNINAKCGATDTQALQHAVVEHGADIGVALDGDADRLIVVDEKGAKVDGDQLMGLLAADWKENGHLSPPKLAATVMSNLGLERHLKRSGIEMIRTKVGDRYVFEAMREQSIKIGGEQSGHLILSDFSTTGDGLLAATYICTMLKLSGKLASEMLNVFKPVPQILKNFTYDKAKGSPLDRQEVSSYLEAQAKEIEDKGGRLLVRASGTEPKIRVMAEGDDAAEVEAMVDQIVENLQQRAA